MPWQLYGDTRESIATRYVRLSLSIVVLTAGIVSVLVSPPFWGVLVIYITLGLVVGVLGNIDELTGIVALLIFLVGVGAGASALGRFAPKWEVAWWQPSLITLGAIAAVTIVPLVFHRRR
jgi:hypothetical protein